MVAHPAPTTDSGRLFRDGESRLHNGLTGGGARRSLPHMADPVSEELFARASKVIPGGVNSPVRAFRAVGGEPIFIREAHGPVLVGADGTEYIDYVGSWGPIILGHAHPDVVDAIRKAAEKGTSYGAPTESENRHRGANPRCRSVDGDVATRVERNRGDHGCVEDRPRFHGA